MKKLKRNKESKNTSNFIIKNHGKNILKFTNKYFGKLKRDELD